MTIELHPIVDRQQWLALRKQDVTASVAACLFGDGVHPYQTALQLWQEKSGLVASSVEESPAMRRGRLLEPVVLAMLREERPNWRIEQSKFYYRDPDTQIGATPDVYGLDEDGRSIIVQLKTVGHWAYKKGWLDPDTGEVETPLWIAIQASVEAALTGAERAFVAVMALGDGGLDMHIEEVPIKPALVAKLEEKCAEFWRRVQKNDPYPPDWKRDVAAVLALYADKNGSVLDLTDDKDGRERLEALLKERAGYKEAEKAGVTAVEARKIVDAQIVQRLGNASGARIGSTLVTVSTIKKKAYSVKETQYQQVRVK